MADTSDLVERLRDDYQKTVELCAEAADALERMGRIENVAIGVLHDKLDEAQATIAAKDADLHAQQVIINSQQERLAAKDAEIARLNQERVPTMKTAIKERLRELEGK